MIILCLGVSCAILSTFMKQRTYSMFTSGVDKATEPGMSFAPYLDPIGETKVAVAETLGA
jgi:ABC-type Mn2+/Zn2+ transport system permease subunit